MLSILLKSYWNPSHLSQKLTAPSELSILLKSYWNTLADNGMLVKALIFQFF
ncbi:hypothetical protein ADU37_CDS13360 [Thermococcus sp. 2319x1]|nr:hypothetical protein ADU37_CDS13360 [Thermococcus sp. 2319x1]